MFHSPPILICMKSLLFCFTLIMSSIFVAYGQEPVELSLQAYTVGRYQQGVTTPVPATPALQQHCRRRVSAMTPPTGAELQWQRAELVEYPNQGWRYLTYWQQGNARLVASFNVLLRDGAWQVLAVGGYQLCRCQNCSEVAFAPEGFGCACQASDSCTFLVGETLH